MPGRKSILARIGSLFKSRRLQKLRRSPKIFIPIPHKWIVISFKPVSIILVIMLFACSTYLVFRSDIFLVRNLEFITDKPLRGSVLTEGDLRIVLDHYITRSMFRINTGELQASLLDKYLALKEVKIERHFPDSLYIFWQEREALVVVVKDGKKFLVDHEGLLYAEIPGEVNIPEIQGAWKEELSIGEKLESDYLESCLMVINYLMGNNDLKMELATLDTGGILRLTSKEGWRVIFSLEKETESDLQTLVAIISRYARENETFSEIDLRFKYPVVR
ncbi:FtsQ-type POTRA domain-containing protein [Patescibacteria group bacterium]|nr:FtsQ-type POTRA domain-containing protein [Patescibacteria group bacterium]MBU1868232.1 FtsQ-type POTRA domain-containing protein [Patescibacteria group bacterium]